MSVILFETKRLTCRPLSAADTDEMYGVYSDADAMRWVDDGQPIARGACAQWVEVTLRNYASRGYGMSVLVSRQTQTVVGFCGLVHPDSQPEAEIKYALYRQFWGLGLATEAVVAMLDYGRHKLQLHEIIATVAPENVASRRVLLKAGMQAVADRHNPDGSLTNVFKWPSSQLASDRP